MTIHRSVDAAVNRSGGKPRLDGRFALAVDYRCWGMNEFRIIRLLVGCHLAVSVVTPGIIVALRDHSAEVNSAVWTRGVIVVAGALLTRLRRPSGPRAPPFVPAAADRRGRRARGDRGHQRGAGDVSRVDEDRPGDLRSVPGRRRRARQPRFRAIVVRLSALVIEDRGRRVGTACGVPCRCWRCPRPSPTRRACAAAILWTFVTVRPPAARMQGGVPGADRARVLARVNTAYGGLLFACGPHLALRRCRPRAPGRRVARARRRYPCGLLGRTDYPFTAPAIAATMCRCAMTKTMMIGASEMIEPAASEVQSVEV